MLFPSTRAVLLSTAAIAMSQFATAHDRTTALDHAPIGVMGDHLHKKGEIMTSVRLMHMTMDGNRTDTDRQSQDQVHQAGFPVAPTSMPMQMLMAGMMYAPSDEVTVMVMLPYIQQEMDHHLCMPPATAPACGGNEREFTTKSNGIGDLKLSAMIGMADVVDANAHFTVGVNVPTGSIDQSDDTPAGNAALPYAMQPGSGTWDVRLGFTYNSKLADKSSWGAQSGLTFRTGENDRGYRLGNRGHATAWIAHELSKSLSGSVRAEAVRWSDVNGANLGGMAPTQRADLRAGERLDIGFGVNWAAQGDSLNGQRLAFEVMLPTYQDLDGPQLETDLSVTVGWQKAWH
ncbi:MAG: hypothetical protein ACI91G_000787 [Gammaproteobacteria bacterium]|jgi:hypothetical protein